MDFVVLVRQRARGNVSVAMVVWAVVMAVVLFIWEVRSAPDVRVSLAGVVATLLLGVYLGWRQRGAAVFVAPMVSWSFAWLPLWIAAMIRHGALKGLFVGFFLVTVGWLLIGTLEFLGLGAVSLMVRRLRGGRPPDDDDEVVIFGPDGRR
ncbi:MAG: hypothetical protein HIU57_04920 [Acidobacteria bacterium]|nr:hypothetical protein [Acidobacteriota bacterium]